ncbi:MAG: hypothetical protein AABX51_08710 [Nanoarchaeota archaeon]
MIKTIHIPVVDVAGNYIVTIPREVREGGEYAGKPSIDVIASLETGLDREEIVSHIEKVIRAAENIDLEGLAGKLMQAGYEINSPNGYH